MTEQYAEGTDSKRWRYLLVLLLIASVVQGARIWNVRSSTGEMPFLSANDRSRWCTILALTTGNNFVIDDILEIRDPKTKRRTWYSIDIVQHRGWDGKQHYYSSKPPLFSTLIAGVYWVVRAVTGATLTGQPFLVVPIVLFIVNLLPLIALWWLLLKWANQESVDTWQAVTLGTFATFGTFLSTFVITLNNHLPAAIATALSLVCLIRVLLKDDQRVIWFIGCGLATSFAVTCELPALSWLFVSGSLLFLANWRKALKAYFPATLPVLAAFLGMNYLAHGTVRPAYSMRNIGRQIVEVDWPMAPSASIVDPSLVQVGEQTSPADLTKLVMLLRENGFQLGSQPVIRKARREGVWELWDEVSHWKFALKWNEDHSKLSIHHWSDWYDFPTSYWKDDRKQGVDRGEPDRLSYAFHCLIGHHGVLSLTPFWCLSLVGAATVVFRTSQTRRWSDRQFQIVIAIVVTSAVVMAFYITRPLEDRNYGGVTSGLRWMFWFVPLWYWLAIRGIRSVHGGWQWLLVCATLIVSLISANVPWSNPWTSPWLSHWIPL